MSHSFAPFLLYNALCSQTLASIFIPPKHQHSRCFHLFSPASLINESYMYADVNECMGINNCQQVCTNTEGLSLFL